jgi:GDPmannose 4,6-dehydratase
LGDASKAKKQLGWAPKTTFAELVSMMAKADFEALRDDAKTPKMFY